MSASTCRFSVVIPTYNRPHHVRRCLNALTRLNYPVAQFEVIVVDDGSPNPLDTCIEPFQERLDIKLLRQENRGPGSARNTGAAVARGTFLAFTDDDCRPAASWLKTLEATLGLSGQPHWRSDDQSAVPQPVCCCEPSSY